MLVLGAETVEGTDDGRFTAGRTVHGTWRTGHVTGESGSRSRVRGRARVRGRNGSLYVASDITAYPLKLGSTVESE